MWHSPGMSMVLLVAASLLHAWSGCAAPPGDAHTADPSEPYLGLCAYETVLHELVAASDLVVRGRVLEHRVVDLVGRPPATVETIEVLEVLHQDHGRPAVLRGDTIERFLDQVGDDRWGDVPDYEMDVGVHGVFLLVAHTSEALDGTHEDWQAAWYLPPGGPQYSRQFSMVAPTTFGDYPGLFAGSSQGAFAIADVRSELRFVAGGLEIDRGITWRTEAYAAIEHGMPWEHFLAWVREVAAEQRQAATPPSRAAPTDSSRR